MWSTCIALPGVLAACKACDIIFMSIVAVSGVKTTLCNTIGQLSEPAL